MKAPFFLAASTVLLTAAAPLSAQTSTDWTGLGDASLWTDGDNWSGGTAPNNALPTTWDVTVDSFDAITVDTDIALTHADLITATFVGAGHQLTAGTMELGNVYLESGTLTLGGQIALGSDAHPFAELSVEEGSTLINQGTLTHTSRWDDVSGETVAGDFYLYGTFENAAGATYRFVAEDLYDATIQGNSFGAAGRFINHGALVKDGVERAKIDGNLSFENHGTVTVNAGELEINASSGSSDATGSFTIAENATLRFTDSASYLHTYSLSGADASITGDGTLAVSDYGQLIIGDESSVNVDRLLVEQEGVFTVTSTGSFTAREMSVDGYVHLDSDATVQTADLQSGELTGSGAWEVTGDANIREFSLGGGTKTFSGDTTLQDAELGVISSLTVQAATEAINQGTFTQRSEAGSVVSELVLEESNSTFRNAAGATYQAESEGDSQITTVNATDEATASFQNEGTFVKTGLGQTTVTDGVEFVNTGSLDIREGRFLIAGALSGDGSILLSGGQLAHEVASGTDLGGQIAATSGLAGGEATRVALREGYLTTGVAEIDLSFALEASTAESFSIGERRTSDVLSLTSTGDLVYALELTVDFTPEAPEHTYLGWLNESGQWVNAVDGNTVQSGYDFFNGTFEDFRTAYGDDLSLLIGAWGGTGDTVWAVLDHQSEFAVVAIPEPGTWGLILTGLGAVAFAARRRRQQAALQG